MKRAIVMNRGRLTLWVDQDAIAAWRYTGPSDDRDRPRVYADAAIECALVLKSVFHVPVGSINSNARARSRSPSGD